MAALSNWSAFDRILNAERSGFLISNGQSPILANPSGVPLTEVQQQDNEVMQLALEARGKMLGGKKVLSRSDQMTYKVAKEFLSVNQPRVLYISFGRTDSAAHNGQYDFYLKAAQDVDGHIRDLWEHVQSQPAYKDKTTLLITVDHGRGLGASWVRHGRNVERSDEVWFAVMGPDTPSTGEVTEQEQIYQDQFAQTIAAFLGLRFETPNPTGGVIESAFHTH